MSTGDERACVTFPSSVVAETHISWVLFSGDRAFKIYKPLATDVLDHGTVAARRVACAREVALNARLAPRVYDGVGTISLGGDELEPVIVMKRMPADRCLTRLVETDDALAATRQVARTMARFHASLGPLDRSEAESVASLAALTARWTDDLAGIVDVVGSESAWAEQLAEIGRLAFAYLAGRSAMLDERIDRGLVVDGHGDLLADDIFCVADGPQILDCLAFSDRLRWGDVLADVGFLVMDLQRLGHPDVASAFLRDYCEFSGEHHPGSLAHFYVAQRALVRAKVTALRATQTPMAGTEASALLDLCLDHLRRAEVRVVLVGGLPGSGKSTAADRLADEFGWPVLSSDEIRRDLRLRYEDLHDAQAYDATTVGRVYDEMRARARHLVARGTSVILDATWTSGRERELARALTEETGSRLIEVRCEAPRDVLRSRVAQRQHTGWSEASADVVDVLHDRRDPWPEAHVVHTSIGTRNDVWLALAASLAREWTQPWGRPTASTGRRPRSSAT